MAIDENGLRVHEAARVAGAEQPVECFHDTFVYELDDILFHWMLTKNPSRAEVRTKIIELFTPYLAPKRESLIVLEQARDALCDILDQRWSPAGISEENADKGRAAIIALTEAVEEQGIRA